MDESVLLERITQLVIEELKNNKVSLDGLFEKALKEEAKAGESKDEVVIGISPTFNQEVKQTLSGANHKDVIREIIAGIEEEGLKARVIKVYTSADVALQLLLIDAREKGTIKKVNGMWMYGEDTILGATDESIILWFKIPENKSVLELIRNETYPEYMAKTKNK